MDGTSNIVNNSAQWAGGKPQYIAIYTDSAVSFESMQVLGSFNWPEFVESDVMHAPSRSSTTTVPIPVALLVHAPLVAVHRS